MKADAKGVLLHKCEPLYLHCGNVFEAVMPNPFRLMALEHVVAKILRPSGEQCGTAPQDWPRMHATQFSAVTGLGSVSSVCVSQC